MKRARLSYDNWTCMLERRRTGCMLRTEGFSGHASLLHIDLVTGPQTWQVDGRTFTVCENGISWLSLLPEDDFYCITAMMDKTGKIVLWYIDMIFDQGVDPDGVPWFHDLYLDLVVLPDGTIIVDDRDELDEALTLGDITPAQHQLALDTAQRLMQGPLRDLSAFAAFTDACLALVQEGNGHSGNE